MRTSPAGGRKVSKVSAPLRKSYGYSDTNGDQSSVVGIFSRPAGILSRTSVHPYVGAKWQMRNGGALTKRRGYGFSISGMTRAFSAAILIYTDEPRALPWAGMSQTFGLGTGPPSVCWELAGLRSGILQAIGLFTQAGAANFI